MSPRRHQLPSLSSLHCHHDHHNFISVISSVVEYQMSVCMCMYMCTYIPECMRKLSRLSRNDFLLSHPDSTLTGI